MDEFTFNDTQLAFIRDVLRQNGWEVEGPPHDTWCSPAGVWPTLIVYVCADRTLLCTGDRRSVRLNHAQALEVARSKRQLTEAS